MAVLSDLRIVFVVVGLSGILSHSDAAVVTGGVTIDAKPVRGALVTVFSADNGVSETVFTDAAGRYRLDTQFTGSLSLRARAPLAADSLVKVEIEHSKVKLTQEFSLRRLTTAQEISDNLPASAHYARIKFPTKALSNQFLADCTPCHQIGNAMTRKNRGLEGWKAILPSMLQFADYTKNVHLDDYAAALSKAFDGTPTTAHQNTAVDAQVLTAKIIEWKLPESQFPHDSEVDPATGKFYTVDLFVDKLWITDPKTNKTTIIPIPDLGVPVGGSFASADGAPTWVPKIRHGNHSLHKSTFDGLFYLTGSVGGGDWHL